MNLTLATQQQFNSVMCDFWENENGDVFMTINQLSKALDYSSRDAIEKIVKRNEYLTDIEFSMTDKLSADDGKLRETRVLTEDGIYEVTMLSKQPKARTFRAFVRKTLKALRKGEMVLVQPQTLDAESEIKKMRAEAMLNNSRTRQAKLILDMQKNKTLSPIAVELLQVNALEVLSDQAIDYRPEVEKSYTATDIGTELGISPQKVGSIANKHNLKTDEFGYFVLDKSPYSNKQVESFRYFEKGRKKIQEIVQGDVV
ncbi:BRO family protein [Lysinibacillus xylanilyticus]|uniref:BRO family protein n=1 Tax=Lysinibacillus xylanilyticus TaxID=582475 RepID=UPI003D0912C1